MIKKNIFLFIVLSICLLLFSCASDIEQSNSFITDISNAIDKNNESIFPEESEPVYTGPIYAEGTVQIDRTLTPKVITKGLSTNEIKSTRGDTDLWAQLNNKLTDGRISSDGSDSSIFFGTGEEINVIIDLGKRINGIADFSIHAAHGHYGINPIASVQYFISDDGENWFPVAPPVLAEDCSSVSTNGNWIIYDYKIELNLGVSGQYIKYVVSPSNHVWIGEVSAVIYG